MRLLVKNVIVSVTLALSDFISFILSLYIALGVLSLIVEKNDYLLLTNEIDGWFLLHWILGVCCVGWYSVREGANKQVISSQADSLIKISRIWADFFPANTSNQPI